MFVKADMLANLSMVCLALTNGAFGFMFELYFIANHWSTNAKHDMLVKQAHILVSLGKHRKM
jgi:hypothetical protein